MKLKGPDYLFWVTAMNSHEGVFKVKGKKHNCLKILFSLNLRVLTSGGKMENVDRHWWESFGLV